MSGNRYIKQAIIAAICEHPDREEYRARAFANENIHEVTEAMAKPQSFCKEDFLALSDKGKSFLDCPGAWKNFDKIVELVHRNGECFTFEDFCRRSMAVGENAPVLLELARIHNGLGKVFSFDAWKGRADEMEMVWYAVPLVPRRDIFKNDGVLDETLKRRLYAFEGRTLPEDTLRRSGVTRKELRMALISKENLPLVAEKLKKAGDHLRKEYVLMLDEEGRTAFREEGAFQNYATIVSLLAQGGERLDISDFLFRMPNTKTILQSAYEFQKLDRVFAPAHWASRLHEMVDLWDKTLPAWRSVMSARQFDQAYAAAEDLTYRPALDDRKISSKNDLLAPLGTERGAPVLPLGMKAFWDRTSQYGHVLSSLTLSDLRAQSGCLEDTCLVTAAKLGHFSRVVDIARQSKEKITTEDFLSKDSDGRRLIDILSEQDQLHLAFSGDLWAGRVEEMKALWRKMTEVQRKRVDLQNAEVEAMQATLRSTGKGRIKIQLGKKDANR